MRQQTCTTVTLRQRPIRNGRISLYLDYYPAVRNPKTMKLSRREYLGTVVKRIKLYNELIANVI